MVNAPANTGKEITNKIAVKYTLQINKGNLDQPMAALRKLIIVHRKFNEPPILDTPATCILKIARSTPLLGCPTKDDKGGYKVQPPPTPLDSNILRTNRVNLAGNSQNERLFKRGNAISLLPNIKGINQLLNPPIKTGITKKKIIINPWAVIITLYALSDKKVGPGIRNSVRISNLKILPTNPENNPKIR